MEEENKKYKNRALIGTILFHAVLVLGFVLFGLTTPLPLPEEEGVLVNLGFSEQGTGQRQPLTSSPPPPQPQPTTSSEAAENVATQSTEESVAIPDSPKDREQPNEETRPEERPRPQETVQEQPQPEPEPEPQVNPDALFPGRDRQTTTSQNQGDSGEPGNQGRADGSTDGTSTTGGGAGNGPSFSLEGRRRIHIPEPEYTTQSQGRVVVSIRVNRQGQVTFASAEIKGSTTTDRVLQAAAEAAAMKAEFDVKNDAPIEQRGTITFNFILSDN